VRRMMEETKFSLCNARQKQYNKAMNKNIETQKIKVNNGQELINKAQEYKNSGGE